MHNDMLLSQVLLLNHRLLLTPSIVEVVGEMWWSGIIKWILPLQLMNTKFL